MREGRSGFATQGPARVQGMGAGGRTCPPHRVLHPRAARLPDLHGPPACAATVIDPQGRVVYSGRDIQKGQQVFLHNGLMEYGSAFGHGAYLGPDYTADYLRRSANLIKRSYGGDASDSAGRRAIADLRTNRYDKGTGTLTLTSAQAAAFRRLVGHYSQFFSDPRTDHGLREKAITNPTQLRRLTAFFAWTAWAASTERPGHNYSYTNNWPPEPRVDNRPTANVVVWSVLSLIALLGGIGVLFAAFGRWGRNLGWHGREQATLTFRSPGDVALTPAQRATAWFFFVMAALFLIQTFVGAAAQHYRAEIDSFFGFDLARWFPYNLMRTWHVQLALFWVATSFVAAGIFLAPMIARTGAQAPGQACLRPARRPRSGGVRNADRVLPRRARGAEGRGLELVRASGLRVPRPRPALAGAPVDRPVRVGVHALARAPAEACHGAPGATCRGCSSSPPAPSRPSTPSGLLARTGDNFTTTEFWRFWVVHLWVEDFLELFTTVMVAYMFVLLGVVREKVALTVVFLDIILYSVGGVVGHHAPPVLLRRAGRAHGARRLLLGGGGDPAHLPHRRGVELPAARRCPGVPLRHSRSRIAGRSCSWSSSASGTSSAPGIFGFLINLPIVSYYEIGTALTANHGHAAMMGVYGMLALGLAMFCLRYLIPAEVAGEMGADLLLVDQHRPGLDVLRHAAAARASSSSTSRSTRATSRLAS